MPAEIKSDGSLAQRIIEQLQEDKIMALTKKGEYYYGDGTDDLIAELDRYSKLNEYPINETEKMICLSCGSDLFRLLSDDDENGAVGQCVKCSEKHFVRDSQRYLDEHLDTSKCLCGNDKFHIVTGISFYTGSNDVRWVYVGAYCFKCGLLGNYIDWNEH